jgi:hypothetical protein
MAVPGDVEREFARAQEKYDSTVQTAVELLLDNGAVYLNMGEFVCGGAVPQKRVRGAVVRLFLRTPLGGGGAHPRAREWAVQGHA